MITWHQWAVSYRAKCITEIPQSKSPKQICLASGEIWGVGIMHSIGSENMSTEEFISNFNKYCADHIEDLPTIGTDFSIDSQVLIDEEGVIWLREWNSWKRIKTAININNVIEFRHAEREEWGFYIICADDTGLNVCQEEPEGAQFYYYIHAQPSGWGPATEHFKRFPVE